MQATLQKSANQCISCKATSSSMNSAKLFKPVGIKPLYRLGHTKRVARPIAVRAHLEGFEDAIFHGTDRIPSLLDHIAATLTTSAFFLADADPAAAVDAAAAVADTAAKKGGFMSVFTDSFETFLKMIDGALDSAHVPYSYGFSIIVLTMLVKLATYPLSKKQVESTLSMQALQPKVKELQAKYANDPERLQVETAKMYQTAGVNPLAGCLPTLATIPVFIGLYRALSNVADEGLLTEGFFWIPSLAGPTKLNGGLGWLSLQDGAPPLGWHDTASYLVLPILLVISQYISQKIISPQQNQDPSQQQANAILKFIPFMIGWFSLNVPSGLTLYWFTNNLVTTAQQVYLRRSFDASKANEAGTGVIASGPGTYVAPKQEVEDNRPKGKEVNARRSPKTIDVEIESSSSSSSSSQGGDKGARFRAIKAREAAKKAANVAGTNGSSGAAPAVEAEVVQAESSPAAAHASDSGEGKDSLMVPGEIVEAGSEEAGGMAAAAKARGKQGGKKGGKKSDKKR